MAMPERIQQEPGHGQRSPREEGLLFSTNFPPFDPKREGLSERDIYLSNADMQTLETRFAALISKSQKKGLSGPAIFGLGLTGGIVGGALSTGAVIYVPRVLSAEHKSIDSFENSFNTKRPVLVETNTVNPDEVFDNTATRGVISERNTIKMTPEEYQKIAPPPINKETPEQFNFLFPIAFPNGLDGRKIEIKRSGDWMGGGKRTIDPVIDPATQRAVAEKGRFVVSNSITITDGLREGDILVSPAIGMISSGLTITGIDEAGNEFTIMMGGRSDLERIKEIPSSRTEEVLLDNGYKGLRTIESHVPIEQGEIIGIIRNASKGPLGMGGAGGIGQFQMIIFSTVVTEDGTKQIGAADSRINASPDNKVYILK